MNETSLEYWNACEIAISNSKELRIVFVFIKDNVPKTKR